MFEFTMTELGALFMSLRLLLSHIEDDDNAPKEVIETTKTTLHKLCEIMEMRAQLDNDFQSIVETSLLDVEKYSKVIINETKPEGQN